MKKKLHLFFIFITLNCFAQFSKTHYIPPLISAKGLVEDQYIYISTPSLVNVNFKIIANGVNVIYGSVNSNNPYQYSIGKGDNTQLFTPITKTGIIANKGYIIEAEDLIYVSVRVNATLNEKGGYNHAGGLVSKGNSALGRTFRLGAMLNPLFDETLLNFASILATENGTKISISNLKIGTKLLNGTIVSGPILITLNKNESYMLALQNYDDGNTVSNSSKIIGALVSSDKPVVVNSGSFGGSNSTLLGKLENGQIAPVGRDLGFDQIVSLEKTGKEYIFIKGVGTDELERILLVAHSDQTQIYINGNTTPYKTLNSGEYITLDGSQFIDGNMYITTTQNIFAYQSIGGSNSPANQNLFFVPPINCSTPNTVDNIPQIQAIGSTTLKGFLNIVTESGATVLLNNNPITDTPIAIIGNSNFVRYSLVNLSGNIAVKSTKQVYVSYFGTNGAATIGGYYSGFDLKPEIVSGKISVGNSSCIPNISLKINTLSSYDTFQWYKDDSEIPLEINNNYTPKQPGFYKVRGSISGCISDVFSDKIPVSECPINNDNDLVNDNIDIDYDNDGILNCTESYGDKPINSANLNSGIVTTGTYSNSFTAKILKTEPSAIIPFNGNSDGSFVTEVMPGKGFQVSYNLKFTNPINLRLEYVTNANVTDLLNSDSEYIVNSDIDKTVTVLNPSNQLLIDTNYDGIYESGVTQFSSFEIRFRLNGTIPLTAGSGTFSFQSYQTKTFNITHKNLLDTAGNKATFKLIATCVPKDSDGDGIPDQLDLDSDNDGIPDSIENQKKPKPLSNIDINLDGLDDIFEPQTNPIDTDNDGIPNYLDLDSDNDGIYDLVESGSNAVDSDKNGILDTIVFGINGLADSLETNPDSGILNYIVADTDQDGIKDQTELDSDNDSCPDVIEAGFLDANGDGYLGSIAPPTVNSNGKVTSGVGYSIPNPNYVISAPIVITSQPTTSPTCEFENAKISIDANGGNTYQWQLSTDGINWNNLVNNINYNDVNANTLLIKKVTNSMIGYKFRVQLKKIGNSCGLTSDIVSLNINSLPILNSPITIVQCDDDTDGISNFNVKEKNSFISSNYTNETFSYYTTQAGAINKESETFITNPIAFTSANNRIWVRVENKNGCFSIAQLELIVSTTQIPSSFKKEIEVCDDFIDNVNNDKDGIATFDFSTTINSIESLLPSPSSNYLIKLYMTEKDALAETNAIQNSTNYRNTTKNQQDIWVRIDSNLDNACFGLGRYITLIVNPKPEINTYEIKKADGIVCTNLPDFYTTLDAGLIDNTSSNNYSYVWEKDGVLIPNEKNSTLDVNEVGIYNVTVSTSKGCNRTIKNITIASDIAHLNSISISDLSDNNTVTVNISGQGNYEYSIDLPNGPFQESNYLENVPTGIHDLYINDKNGCGIIKKTIAILGIPKFFTPNNDGYNDYWNIKGANETFNSGAIIFIYDRYGKLIKQILASSDGWDGTYVGNAMPSDDYWYTIKLEDGREAKGHFSLKR